MAAEKSPAFQFYPREFLADENVLAMELDEIGAYVQLMCICWTEGSIPADPARLARILKCTPARLKKMWITLGPCFDAGEDGRLIHGRLERERAKQREYTASQSASGHKGAEKRWQGHGDPNGGAMPSRMANDGFAVSSLQSADNTTTPGAVAPGGNGEKPEEPVTPPPGKPKPPGARKPTGGWPARFGQAWEGAYDGVAPIKPIGKHIKPLVDREGEDVVYAVWLWYLGATDGQYASPSNFAQKFGTWRSRAAPAPVVSLDLRRVRQWSHDHPRETFDLRQSIRESLEADHRGDDLERLTTAEFQRRVLALLAEEVAA